MLILRRLSMRATVLTLILACVPGCFAGDPFLPGTEDPGLDGGVADGSSGHTQSKPEQGGGSGAAGSANPLPDAGTAPTPAFDPSTAVNDVTLTEEAACPEYEASLKKNMQRASCAKTLALCPELLPDSSCILRNQGALHACEAYLTTVGCDVLLNEDPCNAKMHSNGC
jgi:hypothetical protein